MPCACAALHLTAATCILGKSFTSFTWTKDKAVFLRSALAQSARCPCCARLRPHSDTHGRPSGLSPCGFVRTRSAGSRLRSKIRMNDEVCQVCAMLSAAEAGVVLRSKCTAALLHFFKPQVLNKISVSAIGFKPFALVL